MNGYWVAYYTNSKRPKSPESIIEKMRSSKDRKTHDETPDVEKFKKKLAKLKREREVV